jgi:hypothetical protein
MRTISDEDRGSNEGIALGRARAVGETPKALRVELDGEERWIPKSQIHDDSEVYGADEDNSEGELIVKRWWAEKEGLA